MKLEVKSTPVITSGLQSQGEFRIKNSAKAFSILSSGLYSNKFQAILRELGCNAYDSHVAAGKADLPFTVHLPTRLNPTLSVRDYGIGLDNDGVINIYTTYFESTKQDSNDYVGCMGLGSKSPFSYTTNFTVTAIKDGMKRVYSAFIGDQGIPNIARLTEEKTDECNGVEVSFPVERGDAQYFEREAHTVFKWFKVIPNFTGVDMTISAPEYSEHNVVPGVHIRKSERWSRADSVVIMGNVAYPISAENANLSPELAKLYNRLGLAIEFNIGDVDIAASREELSYVPQTKQALKDKGEEILAGLTAFLEKKIKDTRTPWNRGEVFDRLLKTNEDFFNPAITRWVTTNPKKVHTLNDISYSGYSVGIELAEFISKVPHVDISLNEINEVRIRDTNGLRMSRVGPGYFAKISQVVRWRPANTVVVLHDATGNVGHRIKAAYSDDMFPDGCEFLILKPTNKKMDAEAAFKKALKLLGSPSATRVFRTSDMPGMPKATGTSKERHVGVLRLEQVSRGYYSANEWKMQPTYTQFADLDPSVGKTFLYVPLMNKSIIWDGKTITAEKFMDLYSEVTQELCGFKPDEKVYGVLKTSTNYVKELPNWKNFFEYIEAKFDNLDWNKLHADATNLQNRNQFKEKINLGKANKKDLVEYHSENPNTVFGKVVKTYLDCTGAKINEKAASRFNSILSSMRTLCPNKTFAHIGLDDVEENFGKVVKNLKARYPLLDHVKIEGDYYSSIDNAGWKDIIEYVKLIDASK